MSVDVTHHRIGAKSLVVAPIAATPMDPKQRYSREHFGFADGISQPKPVIANTQNDLDALLVDEPQAVPAGEFVFGYTNAYWTTPHLAARTQLRAVRKR